MPLTGLGTRQESCSAALYFLGTSGYAFYQNFRLYSVRSRTETNPESVGVEFDDHKLWPYYMELKHMSWANPWNLSEAHVAKQPFLKGVSAACQCMASTKRVPEIN
jgi:hypothetical protein